VLLGDGGRFPDPGPNDLWSLLGFRVVLSPKQVALLEDEMKKRYARQMSAGTVVVKYNRGEKHLMLKRKVEKASEALEFINTPSLGAVCSL